MSAPRKISGWHFAAATLRDGSPLTPKGRVAKFDGEVCPCPTNNDLVAGRGGMHMSERAIDALQYAPGAMVARVELSGSLKSHGNPVDKWAGRRRKNLSGYVDATRVLHEFACWCATQALDREEAAGRKVDPRSRNAINVKLKWLVGTATDSELAAASAAARDSAWAAAGDAARYAASAAAGDDASAAARDAAWAAAWAAWDAQNVELERRLLALLEASR